jgi:NAD(P)-dependent dehydrogenase (short-subunit alcohol dehydrogenase family)
MSGQHPALYRAPRDLLAGRNILVTGAGDGIGRAAAECFAAHGATVILLGRTQAKLDSVYDAITAAGSPEPIIQLLDLATATEQHYAALAQQVEQQLGCLHGVLHNAARLGPRMPLEQYPPGEWRALMAVNVEAAWSLTRALLPALRAAPAASIVFTSSSVGRRGRAFWGAYAVSKFAVEGLCQVLAEELANTSRIRVNCLNPGPTNTAMRREAYPAEVPTRNPAPLAIMPAYLYLMGDASAGVTGQTLDAQQG